MIVQFLTAIFLVAVCVTTHAVGLTIGLRWLRRRADSIRDNFLDRLRVLITIAVWAILIHLVEISVWASFYVWKDCLSDFHSAFYFSAVTYTTTGFGDVVLPEPWRWLSGVEALTGILMCGWSTGFFFAVVNRMQQNEFKG